jgi:NADH dehydrogenase [ubiquinone] 1 alpha subcomplex assembly factor 5
MTGPHELFDRRLLRSRRDRAAASFQRHDFLFAHAAGEIADRLGAVLHEFPLVLDLGAHGGLLGDRLASLPSIGRVIQAAPSEALARGCKPPRLVADEELLPFADQSLDLVVSALSLQSVNDLPGTLVQIRRALKPDGLLMAALLGGDTLSELRQVLIEAELETVGGASPRVAPFADIREAGALLQRAGFALPVIDSETLTVTYAGLTALAHDLRGMGGGNVLTDRSRKAMPRRSFALAETLYRDRFGMANGRIPATFEIIYLSGWAPAESQPKPLKPGSARTRLADALHTEERSAGESTGMKRKPDVDPSEA